MVYFRLNQVRIRDVVEDEPKMFEVHQIESRKADMVLGVTKSSVILRLECDSAYIKDDWVKTVLLHPPTGQRSSSFAQIIRRNKMKIEIINIESLVFFYLVYNQELPWQLGPMTSGPVLLCR